MTRAAPNWSDEMNLDHRRSTEAAAFEAIFRACYNDLYATAFRVVRSRALAEEVVQDVFLILWQQRERWGSGELADLRRYIFAAVRNRAVSRLRRLRLERGWQGRAVTGQEHNPVGEYTAASGAPAERSELLERLDAAITKLPPRTRDTLLLRVRNQLRNTEIAAVLGISVKAVEGNLARAMHLLRLTLGSRL